MAKANSLYSESRPSSKGLTWPLQRFPARLRTATAYKIDISRWALGDGAGSGQIAHAPAASDVWSRSARLFIIVGSAGLCWTLLTAPLWSALLRS